MLSVSLFSLALIASTAPAHADQDLLAAARVECAAIDSSLALWSTEELITTDYSTEGGIIRVTWDEGGTPRRLSVELCGEMGKALWMVYYLKGGQVRTVESEVRYNAHFISEEWDEALTMTTTHECLMVGSELLVWLIDDAPQPVKGREARDMAHSTRSTIDKFLGRLHPGER